MLILYISSLCSRNKYKELFCNAEKKPGMQIQKYHKVLIEGFKNYDVKAITALPINKQNFKKKYLKSSFEKYSNIEFKYLTIWNLKILKNIVVFIEGFISVAINAVKNKECIVICDVLNISLTAGAILAAKIFNKKTIAIVTDMPMFFSESSKINITINNYIIDKFQNYIFLTKYMNEIINKKDKPFVVIEGQVDINMSKFDIKLEDKYQKKVCLYSGALAKQYGVKIMVEAFLKANIENSELHVYGSHDYDEELKIICKTNKNIKYFGVVDNEVVVKEQMKATLLINPRPTNEEYTKYSFPSKNMEYMVSGTPLLTTKLPGMPTEYYEHVYLIEDESVYGLANTLTNILNKEKTELFRKGENAKKFVLNNKNNIIQVEKIMNMLNK